MVGQGDFYVLCMELIMFSEFNRYMPWRFSEITEGLTQEQIAERLDCSVGQVNMLLSGKRKFHSEWITRISKNFNIPEWQLFAKPEEVLPPEYLQWKADYALLDDDRKRIVDDMLLAARVSGEKANGARKKGSA
jgi:transcriptional regulator with XRE-family HTH domain